MVHVGTRILAVEDDERIREAVKLALEDEGWTVEEAGSGEEAVQAFSRQQPDVVLVDIMLPGIDGFELTRRLKKDPRTRDVPVLAVTGHAAFASDPGRAQRAGCDAVLPKPCSPEDLEAAIRHLIQERVTPLKNTR